MKLSKVSADVALALSCAVILVAVLASIWYRPVSAQSSITVKTIADITGDGSAHAISTSGRARWVQIVALKANGAVIRLGDSNVGASQGTPVDAGGGYRYPDETNGLLLYSLSSIYYYAANGDKLSVQYGY